MGTDTKYSVFKKHTSNNAGGYDGLVPVPSYTTTNIRFLREDGTWSIPLDTDQKVLQSASTTTNFRPLILGYNNSTDKSVLANDINNQVYTTTTIYAQPSSGTLYANKFIGKIDWSNIDGKPSCFTPCSHIHSSDQITTLTSYVKTTSDSALSTSDSLNTALGKLEYKGDLGVTAYNLVNAAYDGDGTIENLKEILKVLEGIKDTETIKGLLGKYLPLTGGILTGTLTTVTTGSNYYNQGIRINRTATNQWATLLIGKSGTATSGTGTSTAGDGAWLIGTPASSNSLIFNLNNSSETVGLCLKGHGNTDMRWNNNTVWHAGNDGAGSGLDADLLDGNHASAFAMSGHNHDDRYYTKVESNAKYITNITTSINKLTFTKNESNIIKDITVNVVQSQGNLSNISDGDSTTKASSGLFIYNSYSQTIGTNPYSSVLSINTGGTIQIAGNWGDDQSRNLYWRSQSDRGVASYPWKSWRTILDNENYSSILDSRYYTESEINNLLSNKLNTSNFNWTNLPDKLVVGNEFNIVNDGFNEEFWFNYLPIHDRSKTATINRYCFGNGARGLTFVTASGFIKDGSNSSYVLLGDGGHQTISSLSVDYATSAGNADTVDGYHATTGRTFNGNINWSDNWNDVWSDGTNSHPWYGFDHRYPNTGAYSTTISDFFGMTIKTAQTLKLDFGTLLLNGTNIYNINVASATKLQTAKTIWGQSFDGTANIDNTLRIRQTTDNYCEGIRIQNGDDTWATIILGATSDSGTNTNAWSIHRKADNNFAISRNSSDGVNGLVMTSIGMGLGTTAPAYRLDVRGDTRITGSIRDLAIGGGIYWNSYVESATDGSDAASITVVSSGVAGGTTLVLSQMNDAGDTIQFQTNIAARLYHNSYPILTTQNTYISNNKGYINDTEITQVNNADTVDSLHADSFVRSYNSQAISGDLKGNYIGMSTSSGITSDWWHILCGAWSDEYRWNSQIALPTQNRRGLYYRSGLDNNTAFGPWVRVVDADGNGANGTWSINITGNATTSTKSEYSRSLLGRNMSGSDYGVFADNLVFAEWNTMNDNRWYLKATGYECRVSYANNSDTVDGYHASNLVKFYLSPMAIHASADSAKSWFINTMPSGSGAIVYNVPGAGKTIIAGKSSGAYGHMLQLNYDDTYLRILRYKEGSWKSTDWEKISAGYADSAGNASTASKWATARTITLTGSVTGSVSIDGSGNVSLATTTNHTHAYLPLSGGVMEEKASISWATQNGKTPYIGQYATDGSLLISIEGTSTNNGLVLGGSSGNLLYKGNKVLDAGNYSSYALPKTGGTLTGNLTVKNIIPYSNNSYNIGSTSSRWANSYFTNSIVIGNANTSSTSTSSSMTYLYKGNIELYSNTPFIDFHQNYYNSSYSDYTARIIATAGSGKYGLQLITYDNITLKTTNNGGTVSILSDLLTTRGIIPNSTNTYNIGSSDFYYNNIYTNKVVFNTNTQSFAYTSSSNHFNSANIQFVNTTNSNYAQVFHSNISFKHSYGSTTKYWTIGTICIGNQNSNTAFVISGPERAVCLYGSASDWATLSDIRYKNIICDMSVTTKQLSELPLFKFTYKNSHYKHFGTSAQAVQKILPELVAESDRLYLEYSTLGAISGIMACKEIEKLKDQIKELQNQLNMLLSQN